MAIKITTRQAEVSLGQSHWWGCPDLPKDMVWPMRTITTYDEKNRPVEEDEYLLTFLCQIRLEDIAHLDTEGLLPHEGMLWFFADLDYFLGDLDAPCEGMGPWPPDAFRVLYAKDLSDLHRHSYTWEDGTPATLPAQAILFSPAEAEEYGTKLLGKPAMTEGYEEDEWREDISLLQVDEDEDSQLRFFDCGMVNFMIAPKALQELHFDATTFELHSL